MGFVQSKQGTGNAGTLAITLDSPTSAGNGLIVLVAASGTSANPTSVSAMTLGGVADNFSQISTFGSGTDTAIGATWLDLNCAGGQTAVSITASGGSGTLAVMASVYEWSGLAASSVLDRTANSVSGGSTSWTSTATAATTQAAEVWVGVVFTTQSGAGTITGPGGPWTNLAQVSQAQGSFDDRWISGYQQVAATYAGTVSPSSQWIAKVVTLKLNVSPPAAGPKIYTTAVHRASTW
ncbi:hypothetical protein [Streptomyces sp. BH105]|uniref:hypothetical protein n=1 Tax=Streptomyces sp. BH105 TaxID=3410408 RepID=UPI003CFB95C5